MSISARVVTPMGSRSSKAATSRRRICSLASIVWPRSSNGDCLAPIRELKHLDYYLDELFCRLVQQAVAVDAVPYKRLVGGKHNILILSVTLVKGIVLFVIFAGSV